MQKAEFERTYGRIVSDSEYKVIEAQYMDSDCLDGQDFVKLLSCAEMRAANWARLA